LLNHAEEESGCEWHEIKRPDCVRNRKALPSFFGSYSADS
jgi:hypothetical protein